MTRFFDSFKSPADIEKDLAPFFEAFSDYARRFARMARSTFKAAASNAGSIALAAAAGLALANTFTGAQETSISQLERAQVLQSQLIASGETEATAPIDASWTGDTKASGRSTGLWNIHIAKGEAAWLAASNPGLWPAAFDPVQRALMSDMIFLHERAHLHFTTAMPGLFAGPEDSDPVLAKMAQTFYKKLPSRLASDPTLIDEMFADSMAAQWLIRQSDPAKDPELRRFLDSWIQYRSNSSNAWADHHTSNALLLSANQDWAALRAATPAQSERFAAQAATAGFIRQHQLMADHYNSSPDTLWIGQRVAASLDALGADSTSESQRRWFADARAGRPALDPIVAPWRSNPEDERKLSEKGSFVSGHAEPMLEQMRLPVAGLVDRLAVRRARNLAPPAAGDSMAPVSPRIGMHP